MRKVIDKFEGDNYFLSNFYLTPLVWQNVMYPSSEHAFQAAKTMDMKIRRKIAEAPSPGLAKKMGRVLDLREDWEDIRLHVMEEILVIKFSKTVLKRRLLNTDNTLLVEGNKWNDRFWGACPSPGYNKLDSQIWEGSKHLWYGQNHLGKLLMELRDKLS